jgi:SAM-dependent methyltransferase
MSRTAARTLRITRCSICAGTDFRPLFLGSHPLQRCTNCGAVLSVAYDDPELAYDDRYHTGESGRLVDTDHPAFHVYLRRCNDERLALLHRFATPPGRILDVGCARGDLLATAAASGWDATGVERVASAAATARERHGLTVHDGTLADAGLPAGHFDVVSAFHLLEHVPDAVGFLGELRALTRPGGLVFLEVPNWRSVSRRHFGGRWPHLHPGDHITHFTAQTMRDALRRADLTPIAMQSPSYTGPPQDLGAAAADLCLGRSARLLRPLSGADGSPGRAGWALLHGVDTAYSRLRVGVVLLVVARKAA